MAMKPVKSKVMAKPKSQPTVPPGKPRAGKKIVDYVPAPSAGRSNPASAMKGKGSPRPRNTEGIIKGKISKEKPKAKVTKPRGSTTQTQVGNDNQRERYNQGRDAERKLVLSNRKYRKDFGGTSASGSGAKVSTAQVKKQNEMKSKVGKKGYYLDKNGSRVYPGANETTTAYNSQRAGGKVGSKNAGKSNPMPRKKYKAPKGA